jgi:surface antigen
MQLPVRALAISALLLVAGCSSSPTTSNIAMGPTLPQPNSALATQPAITPASLPTTTAAAQPGSIGLASVAAFVDPAAVRLMTGKDQSEASSAQFNALTFGRPGAPRNWAGDKGTSGSVVVGPYVRVNNIDCRDFTHTVTIGGTPYAKKGTACRETDGTWSVAG